MTDPANNEPTPYKAPEPTPSAAPEPTADTTAAPAPAAYAAPEPTPYAAPYASPVAGETKAQTLSLISLITGILGVVTGFFGWGLLFSIAAVVLGHLGKRREPAAKGMWLTGLITGYVGVLVNAIVIIAFIALIVIGLSQMPTDSY